MKLKLAAFMWYTLYTDIHFLKSFHSSHLFSEVFTSNPVLYINHSTPPMKFPFSLTCFIFPTVALITNILLLLLFSNSVVSDSFVTPWTEACQASLFMGFPRQGYWSGLPFPSPDNLPNPGIEPMSPTSLALPGLSHQRNPKVLYLTSLLHSLSPSLKYKLNKEKFSTFFFIVASSELEQSLAIVSVQ